MANSPLTDDQLAKIQFDQKIGAQAPLTLAFTDETGRTVRLGDCLGGKPAVLILGYYGCPMLCTLVLNGAAGCFRNMTWKAGQQFNVVFVSIDPDETPSLAAEKKTSYVKSYGNECANWSFLTGSQNSITNLANAVGFHYAYDATYKQYAHPSGLVILTGGGQVARYLFGVNFAAKEVDDALRAAAVNTVASTPEPQFTLLCFHYSPIHGKYGNLIMDTIRCCGILTVVLIGGLVFVPLRRAKAEKPK